MKRTGIARLLFVPGNRPERIDKAFASAADLVCIDLEDVVAAADKNDTRRAAIERTMLIWKRGFGPADD